MRISDAKPGDVLRDAEGDAWAVFIGFVQCVAEFSSLAERRAWHEVETDAELAPHNECSGCGLFTSGYSSTSEAAEKYGPFTLLVASGLAMKEDGPDAT